MRRPTLLLLLALALAHATTLVSSTPLWDERDDEVFSRAGDNERRRATMSCATAPSKAEDRRHDKSRLRVAQYNVYFMFWEDDASFCPDPKGSNCPWRDHRDLVHHLERMAEIVYELDADIVHFTEVHDCTVLHELLTIDLLKDSGYKPYLVAGTDSSTGQNVGIITRIDPVGDVWRTSARSDYPVSDNKCDASSSVYGDYGVSKHMFARFNVGGESLFLGGVHFLAFPTESSRCVKREAQAQVIANELFENVNEGEHVIVLGDMNDYDESVPDQANDVPTSRALKFLREYSSSSKDHLRNVADQVPQSSRFTAWWDVDNSCKDEGGQEDTSIDHVLVSPDLYNRLTDVTFFNQAYKMDCDDMWSDHWPIVVEFSTGVSDEFST